MSVRAAALALAALLGAAPGVAVVPAVAQEQESAVRRPEPYNKRHYKTVVRQTLDFTCGAAAVATVLTFYWDRPTTELEVLEVIRKRYTKKEWDQREERGVSFEDLIFVAKQLGYDGMGAKVGVDQLAQAAAPLIVHLDKGKFQHFTVLRRVAQDRFYFSDSVLGETSMAREDFEAQYTGNALAISDPRKKLREGAPLWAVRDGTSVSRVVGDVIVRGVDPHRVGF